jgi:hypothetical protein
VQSLFKKCAAFQKNRKGQTSYTGLHADATAALTTTTGFGLLLALASIRIDKHKWGRFHDMLDEVKQHHRGWLRVSFLDKF